MKEQSSRSDSVQYPRYLGNVLLISLPIHVHTEHGLYQRPVSFVKLVRRDNKSSAAKAEPI